MPVLNPDEQIRITDGEKSLTVSRQAFAAYYNALGYQPDENFGEERRLSPDYGVTDPLTYEFIFGDE